MLHTIWNKPKLCTGKCHCRLINQINIHRILFGVSVCMWLENEVQIEASAVVVGAVFLVWLWLCGRHFVCSCTLVVVLWFSSQKLEMTIVVPLTCHMGLVWKFIYIFFSLCVRAISHCNICMILMFVWFTCTFAFDAQWRTTNAKVNTPLLPMHKRPCTIIPCDN